MTLVWAIELPDSEKIVLLALADCANDEGHCWPSMATLAKKCSKSDRTVQASISSLVDKGHLSRLEIRGRGCRYVVHPRSDFTPEATSPPKPLPQTPEEVSGDPRSGFGQTVIEPSDNHQSPPASDDALRPEHVMETWNKLASDIGRPAIRDMKPARRRFVKARIAENDVDDFLTVFGNIRGSPFLRGDKDWPGATFDWVMKPTNFQKILEGNYNG